MARKVQDLSEFAKLKERIVMFRYATDRSFLRRTSPDQMWIEINRREAWRKHPVAMIATIGVQVACCLVALFSKLSAVDLATVVLCGLFLGALALVNPLVICSELTSLLHQVRISCYRNPVQFYALFILLSPLTCPAIVVAYLVTLVLDLTNGPFMSVCYESMCAIIAHIFIVFTALVIAVRSDTVVEALQVFAGFAFLYHLDTWVAARVELDVNAPAQRNVDVAGRVAFLRLVVYVLTAVAVGVPIYFLICGLIN